MPTKPGSTETSTDGKHISPHTAVLESDDAVKDDTIQAHNETAASDDKLEEDEDGEDGHDDDEDDEPRLKYRKLTSSLRGVYRNGDATSSFLVAGDKMIIGTHNGNIHALDVASLSSIRFYHAHSASTTCLSVSPVPSLSSSLPVFEPSSTARSLRRSPSSTSIKTPVKDSPKASKQPPVSNTPSNQIYIASASLDGHVCVASLVDPADVTLRNFARPVQAVALSPDYKNDRTYLSGGLASQLVVTVDGRPGASAQANTSSAAAAASSWLGSIGLGSNTGKDTVLHSGEGSISAIKFSRTARYVAWINEKGIKVMRSHLKLGNLDPDAAWKRFAHVDRPTKGAWEEMSSVWKGKLEWLRDSELEADDEPTGASNTSTHASKRPERLVVGWGDTAWVLHVHAGSDHSRSSADRVFGKADLVHKLTFDDCILSALSLYTPSLLLVLAYRTRDDDDNPLPQKHAAGSRRQRHNGLQPELRIVNVTDGQEIDTDTLPFDRFATLTASDYHLGTLYVPTSAPVGVKQSQRNAFESLGAGLRDVGTNATRLFVSNASISSGHESPDARRHSLLSPAPSIVRGSASPGTRTSSGSARSIMPPGLKIYLHSPYDMILSMKRDLSDHFTWLLEHCKYAVAWELIDEHPSVVSIPTDSQSERSIPSTPSKAGQGSLADFFDDRGASHSVLSSDDAHARAVDREKARVGELWLNQLIKAEQWPTAGNVAGKVLVSPLRWEHWVVFFADHDRLPEIAQHVPGTDSNIPLPSVVYESVLNHYVKHDRPGFQELLSRWDPRNFETSSVIDTIQGQLDSQQATEESVEAGIAGRDWRILMNGLAKLKLADGLPREALRCHIRLKNSHEAMALIRDHQLVEAVSDDIPALLMLRVSDDQLKTGNLDDLRESSAEVVQLLVSEARERVIEPGEVVRQLEEKGRLFAPLLYLYFRALWQGPEVDPDKILTSADRAHNEEQKIRGRQVVDHFADRAVELFAVHDRTLLLDFLKGSNAYSLDRATEICEENKYVPEQVYLFSKTGQTRRALFLIIKELGDVSQAIAFAKEHTDLWDDLLDYSMGKPPFILALLSEVGTSIDPVQLIKRIPDGLEIQGLKAGIQRMVREYDIQHSISHGAVRIFDAEVSSSMDILRAGRRKAIKFDVVVASSASGRTSRAPSLAPSASTAGRGEVEIRVDQVATRVDESTVRSAGMDDASAGVRVDRHGDRAGRCEGCYDVFGIQETDFLIGFACGHVFHLACLLDRLGVTDEERDLVRSLRSSATYGPGQHGSASAASDSATSGALIRSVNAKISDAQVIRSAVKGGCPVCAA